MTEEIKTEEPKNEFEGIETTETTETVPEQEFSPTATDSQEELISSGNAGVEYDFSNAPDTVKAPPRVNLDGQTVALKKASIILPPQDRAWELTKAGDKKYKYCSFIMYYDKEGQQEYLSGVRVFQRDGEKYSHPTMTRDRNNQASKLLGLYADFRQKNIAEISLKEFLSFLNSGIKVKIRVEEVNNPTTGATITKNMIGEFIA